MFCRLGEAAYTGVMPNTERLNLMRNLLTNRLKRTSLWWIYGKIVKILVRFWYDVCETKNNVFEKTFDNFSCVYKHNLPKENVAAEIYYETERMIQTLSMPFMKIYVCQNNCMIYWSEADKALMQCKFCETPKYKSGKKKSRRGDSTRKRVLDKKMFYLPLIDRLNRLYGRFFRIRCFSSSHTSYEKRTRILTILPYNHHRDVLLMNPNL